MEEPSTLTTGAVNALQVTVDHCVKVSRIVH